MSKSIEETLQEFDFHTVRKIMKLLNWTWWNSIDGDVPTVKQMMECVLALFKDALTEVEETKEGVVLTSGGFEVHIYKDKEFDIKFVPVESSSYLVGM